MATVRVAATDGLTLSELTQEVRDQMPQTLGKVEGTRASKGVLSGLEGSLVTIKGKDNNDVPVLIRAYAIEARGKFHQLIMKFVGDAETSMGSEADAARRGYRLIKGAGPVEPEVDEERLGETGELEEVDAWPEKGPGREGNTLVFQHHNVRWTMPES